MSEGTQREINFDGLRRSATIREARIESDDNFTAEGARVDAGKLKMILFCLESYGRECWASLDTLAEKAEVSRRTLVRGLEVLEARKIIQRATRLIAGRHRNVYMIVWEELVRLAPRPAPSAAAIRAGERRARSASSPAPSPSAIAASPPSAMAPATSATTAPPSAMGAATSAMDGIQSLMNPQEASSTPPAADAEREWGEVEEEVCGVLYDGLQAVEKARERGHSPSQVLAILRHFQEHPQAWLPCHLHKRIKFGHPKLSASEGWPPMRPEYAKQSAAAHAAEKKREAGRRFAELDREWGPALDALAGDDRLGFLQSLPLSLSCAIGRAWPIPADERRLEALECFAARGEARV